jgi:hypothetical protein
VSIDELKDLVSTVPFSPFEIIMANGERLPVPHPDFVWIPPGRRTVAISIREDVVRLLNWQLVSGIEKEVA